MNAFFFGSSTSPLYGVFHQAENTRPSHGVLLCAPFGQEYMRSHRAMRQLATMLSRIGIPVLRFDYHGTGDSAEDLDTATAEQWIDDVNLACDELKETANISTISVIGLRLGALIAAHASINRDDISRLVLWDPVNSGDMYLKELHTAIEEQKHKAANFIAADGTLHFNGFAFNNNLQSSLRKLDFNNIYPENPDTVIHIVSHESDSSNNLQSAWQANSNYQYHHIEAAGDWNYVDGAGGILLPQPIIQGIVEQYKNMEAA